MALYEKRDDVYCGSCGHFTRHYIWRDGRQARNAPNGCFLPLSLGHCAHPRMKDRREDQSCPLWIPRTPDQDPHHSSTSSPVRGCRNRSPTA